MERKTATDPEPIQNGCDLKRPATIATMGPTRYRRSWLQKYPEIFEVSGQSVAEIRRSSDRNVGQKWDDPAKVSTFPKAWQGKCEAVGPGLSRRHGDAGNLLGSQETSQKMDQITS